MEMNRFPDGFKELVRSSTDLVRLISETVVITYNGRIFQGSCPFCDDHDASFSVDSRRQTYRCSSCQVHGDCFSFVMKQKAIGYAEALEMLAKRAGL
jgi:DNA primase